MLKEIAIGDAYGVGFEFASREIIEKDNVLKYYNNSEIDELKAGQYSDDTQMSLAIAELMLTDKEWTSLTIAEYFLNVFKRDVRKGYAKGFYGFLESINTAEEFVEKIRPESNRNGAAMRSVPLGLYKDVDELINKAVIQAGVTHNTNDGIRSSIIVALSSHYFAHKKGKKKDLIKFLESHGISDINTNKTTPCRCDANETIDSVITVLLKSKNLMEILHNSVELGGDTDSVASIACGIASFSDEFGQYIRPFLLNDLENDTYGKDYILKLDKELMDKFLN